MQERISIQSRYSLESVMNLLRKRRSRRSTMWAMMFSWVVLVAAPCGMASVPLVEAAEQTAVEAVEASHEHCMSLPMSAGDATPESSQCCDPTLALKPSELKAPSIEVAFVVASIASIASASEPNTLFRYAQDFAPPDKPVPVYLSTLRIRI